MDKSYYSEYEPIFGVWKIGKLLGEGSFGKVFELEREDFGIAYKAALKTITIPASASEVLDARAEGMDDASIRRHFGAAVQELVQEFALLSRFKGNSNVVSYDNHQVIEHKDGIGWDILIQMELLTPLNRYTTTHTITRQDVIRLGIDLCKALELCQKFNVIHRDVKPENIFVSENGDFKLGDFGIARTAEKTSSSYSKKGTYTYMAPEVYKGEAYGSSVDIYSLGIVMYRLLNGNRTPFLPTPPAYISPADREKALLRRVSGAPLPKPLHAEGRLAEIVLKACAYDPKERYTSPTQMRQELEAILYNREDGRFIYPEGDEVPQNSYADSKGAPKAEDKPEREDKTVSAFDGRPAKEEIPAPPVAGGIESVEQRDRTVSMFDSEPAKEPPASERRDETVSMFDNPPAKEPPKPAPEQEEKTVSAFDSRPAPLEPKGRQKPRFLDRLEQTANPKTISWPMVLCALLASTFCCFAVGRTVNFVAYGNVKHAAMCIRAVFWVGPMAGLLVFICVYQSRKTALLALPCVMLGSYASYCIKYGLDRLKDFSSMSFYQAVMLVVRGRAGSGRPLDVVLFWSAPYAVCLLITIVLGRKVKSRRNMLCVAAVCYVAAYAIALLNAPRRMYFGW